MREVYRKTTCFLTLAGTIPFILYLLVHLKDPENRFCNCFELEYLKIYSLMLMSFISGYIWSYAYQRHSVKLSAIAVIAPFIPWLNYIFDHSSHYFIVDMLYYVGLLMIEGDKYDDHTITKWYFKIRILATAIVVLCLIGITYI